MKTAGEILKETRKAKGLGLSVVARETKIRPPFLLALEADNYEALPTSAITRGFIKNYAEFLELNPEEVLAVHRRDYDEKKVAADAGQKPTPPLKFAWNPKLTTIAGVGLLILVFIAYLVWQYRSLINAPYY